MARIERDRENLLSDATALVERVELLLLDDQRPDESVVIGFRRDGAASVYFGAEPVFQFNTAHELRRAYWQGELYKAERGVLVAMRRERRAAEVVLHRRELSATEYEQFREHLKNKLERLLSHLDSDQYRIVGQIPPEADIVGRGRRLLPALCDAPVARSPRVHGG